MQYKTITSAVVKDLRIKIVYDLYRYLEDWEEKVRDDVCRLLTKGRISENAKCSGEAKNRFA